VLSAADILQPLAPATLWPRVSIRLGVVFVGLTIRGEVDFSANRHDLHCNAVKNTLAM
jgi:hypothetical protein